MRKITFNSKKPRFIALALAFWLAGSGCLATQLLRPVPTVVVTQVNTRLVTQAVTQEVTRVVEVPVTVTPLPSPTASPTPKTTAAGTAIPAMSGLPQAVLPQYTDCLYGPADYFVYKTSFPAGHVVEVLGRSEDSAWLEIEEVGGWNPCWVRVGQAQLQSAQVADLPLVQPTLPRSEYEFGSPYTSVKRNGDEVTISWKAVYMSADEIQGYLIDAYVCLGGQYLHQPVFLPETFKANTGTITVTIKDEAGCSQPSSAHIVSVGRRGFAEWEKIFWPAH